MDGLERLRSGIVLAKEADSGVSLDESPAGVGSNEAVAILPNHGGTLER